jgi:hypothetical protein
MECCWNPQIWHVSIKHPIECQLGQWLQQCQPQPLPEHMPVLCTFGHARCKKA